MKIVKKENGNILLTDASGNTIKRLPEYAVLEKKEDREGEFVRIAYGHQNKHDIYPSTITNTQIEPAAEVAFSGTAQDLLNLLSTSFFFEVVSGDSAYTSGAYVNFLPTYASLSTVNFTADIFHGAIVEISETIKIDESYARVNTASTGSGIIGIYKLNQSSGDWERVLEATGLDLTVVGSQFLSYSEITLQKGIYATGFILENATIMNRSNVNAMELVLGRSTMNNATSYINTMQFSYVYDGTLPLIAPSPSLASQGTVISATYHKIV